ncbi:UDP-N-acetylmuramoyl-tripeptide--D-alanyl-D-alanine ligase [Vulgatibacter incomptus]|uniref:UDP-N-acetylmuramoyl-tripeptide--D-alanyl-D-alanine ligase n=1 Tax=Vulgatibacter incomptus TaxID=1391653 RepID=A0A0K1PEE3_9BACT|nr:UDP-N-acetylmuramoyl-tripeptide--D-alanyl-D-alanine ligase [Vulgatibacter incomptus]AKU91867.1 UDP-N-acetylmuramoylalanyl-D-glutamyl-2,6-diaminopimelate--D-alanyl-D-alanine ligase [Vulgatibacter incomptus]
MTNRAIFCLADVKAAVRGALRAGEPLLALDGVSTDSRTVSEGNLFVALGGESFDGNAFVAQAARAGARAALVREGFTPSEPLPAGFGLVETSDTLAALGALARVHRRRFPSLKLGAVTGSNGKTTTKELAHAAISFAFGESLKTEGNLNNEIGLPLTLLRLDPSHRAAVVEMGMSNPGEIGRLAAIAEPSAGLVTCAQAVHLEGLGSIEAVAKAKGELFHGLPPGAVAVANLDDPLTLAEARASRRPLLTFGTGAEADVRLVRIVSHDLRGLAFEVSFRGSDPAFVRIPLVGLHNAQNACAALALGLALGAAPDRLLTGLAAAKGFLRRLELKAAPGGVTVLDDCYNGNPASAVAALRTSRALAGEGRVVAVLGDLRELGSFEESGHREVGAAAAEAKVAGLVAFGPRSRTTAAEAAARGIPDAAILSTDDPAEALAWLRRSLREGDLVLFKASRGTRLERIADPLVKGEEV